MSPSSTQHHAARRNRSATRRGSAPCQSATFAANSYLSEPETAPEGSFGASSSQTCSFSIGLTSASSPKSSSLPVYPQREHMWMKYGSGCAPTARSWKSVRFPPNELVDRTAWELNLLKHIGHVSSI